MKYALPNWSVHQLNEAAWRNLWFPIHEQDPAVVQLAIHLENGQRVFFTNETAIDRAINPPKTTLTAFFELCNRADDFGAFCTNITLFTSTTLFPHGLKQKHGCPASKAHQLLHVSIYLNQSALGRLFTVSQDYTECFYLRLLLVNVTGPLSFQDMRKVNGQQ
ncbi:ATP-dependent DNA helicase [Trichonephila clavipes]|uniref:ATP-dependent DNA helicase n=1 Tax=Trichonephila clavipes TaxID=2585209 RepID=A0A8X6RGV7_TRICX|nr:ATP-dependent DNA helicase [Trichonephila clavipes]